MSTPADDDEDDATPWRAGPVRDYVFIGLVALVVVFVVMTVRGSPLAGLLAPLVASLGLVFRWSGIPAVFLLLLTYLLVFPFAVPFFRPGTNDIAGSQFRLLDLVLVGAALVYFVCQFRALGLTLRAMPSDAVGAADKKPTRRPPAIVPEGEIPGLGWLAAGVVFAGQVAWLLLTVLRVDFASAPPLAFTDPGSSPWAVGHFGTSAPTSRLFLLLAALGLGGLAARLGFWYWRLARLTRDEAGMVLLDTGWRDARREMNRQAKWAAWARPGGRYAGPVEPPPRQSRWAWLRVAFVAVLGLVATFILTRSVIQILR